jgi:hypothetical protein
MNIIIFLVILLAILRLGRYALRKGREIEEQKNK